MRLLFHLHRALPAHGAGAEAMAHELALGMVARGHEVAVYAADAPPGAYELDGVKIHGRLAHAGVEKLWEWCDMGITHLDQTRAAIGLAKAHGRPLVHLVHNHRQLVVNGVRPADCDLAVFNSAWLAAAVAWSGESVIVRPPVDCSRYRTVPGDRWTLANLTADKGAHVFWTLARERPDLAFLGVLGAYGAQVVPDPLPPNVEVIANTSDMRAVYGRTRCLLMPSAYESWGRVAAEARCSGIPVIAHPTPGLVESLGPFGRFADRNDIGAWLSAVRDVEAAGPDHPHAENPTADLDALEEALVGARERYAAARGPRILPGPVDVYATEIHYVDHLHPIWAALPPDERGRWFVPEALHGPIRALGVPATMVASGRPPRGYTPVLVAAHGDLRGLGDRPAVFVEHGAGQTYLPGDHPAYSGGTDREAVALFIAPSERCALRNANRYPGVPAVAVGCPKLDRWCGVGHRRRDNATVALTWHWNYPGAPEGRSAWDHYRQGVEALVADTERGFEFLGHAHPRAWAWLEEWYASLGILTTDSAEEVFERADVLVADNTSLLYEFASLDRPVVVLNAPWYRRDVHHGGRFWEWSTVGVVIGEPGDLRAAIARAMDDPPAIATERRRIVAEVYAHTDGHAAERAVQALHDVIGAAIARAKPVSEDPYAAKSTVAIGGFVSPRLGITPPIPRLVYLGASSELVSKITADWQTLSEEERVTAVEMFEHLSDDEVRVLIADDMAEMATEKTQPASGVASHASLGTAQDLGEGERPGRAPSSIASIPTQHSTAAKVMQWVGTDIERARTYLAVEVDGQNRSTLIHKLERLVERG